MKHETHTSHHIEMESGDVAYITLPPSEDRPPVANTVSLRELINGFRGSDVDLDFAADGSLLGIEIIAT